jgi:hypothetical protein
MNQKRPNQRQHPKLETVPKMQPMRRRIFGATSSADQQTADGVIEASGLDWTIAGTTGLVNKPSSGPARTSPDLFQGGPNSFSLEVWASVLVRRLA